jgi:hypothetical protein
MFYQERNAGFMTAIDGDIDGVLARFLEFELLDINDEISDEKVGFGGNGHTYGHVDTRHDETAIFIDKVHLNFMVSLLDPVEGHAKSDRTLRVNSGQLAGDDGVEGAEEIQLSVVIGGCVAQNRNLNCHILELLRPPNTSPTP